MPGERGFLLLPVLLPLPSTGTSATLPSCSPSLDRLLFLLTTATWLVSSEFTEPSLVRKLYMLGHEVASSSMHIISLPNATEILGAKLWLNQVDSWSYGTGNRDADQLLRTAGSSIGCGGSSIHGKFACYLSSRRLLTFRWRSCAASERPP